MLCKLKEDLMDFVKREDAIGVVEVILILVVLIGLVIIFRDQLTSLVDSIFKTINEDAGSV
ncbi:MAG: holin, BlyA family protein [Eubacterium sp.]|nr:holin, BlyA family protein [Eubacterium sp.]